MIDFFGAFSLIIVIRLFIVLVDWIILKLSRKGGGGGGQGPY